MIELRNLTKRYGDLVALSRVTFEVQKGELFGLIGPNGAGKTTTLRILATLQFPTTGFARVMGLNTSTQRRQVRAKIGYMPDVLPAYEEFSLRDYLHFFGAAYGLQGRARQKVVDKVSLQAGIRKILDRSVATLSRGQHQRLSLARALVSEPKVLILDEPAAGLDPASRIDLKKLIRTLADEGTTIMISSHILAEVEEITDRIGILDRGKLVAYGSLSELKETCTGSKKINLRVSGDAHKAQEVLNTDPRIANIITDTGGSLTIKLRGENEGHTFIARLLDRSGVGLVSIEVIQPDLEAVFLATTRAEDSGAGQC